MTDYREILRLRSLGLNHSQIAASLGASRTTVIRVLQQAQVLELDWPAAEGLSDKELANRLFPPEEGKPGYKMPDYEQVHREMARSGVTAAALVRVLRQMPEHGRDSLPTEPVQEVLP